MPLAGPRVGAGRRGRHGGCEVGRGASGCRVAQARGVVHAGHEAQPVSRRQPLAATQCAQPPAFQVTGVLLQHREHVILAEGQLLRRLRYVVVQGPRQAILPKGRAPLT